MLQKIPHGSNYSYNIRPSQKKKKVLQSVSETVSLFTEQGPIDKGYPVCICSVSYVMI